MAGAPVVELDGSTSIRDLSSQYEIELPGDAGFETLAGFLLHQFGYIPVAGESVIHDGRTFLVESMERNRIARVKILSAQPAGPSAQPADASPPPGGNQRPADANTAS